MKYSDIKGARPKGLGIEIYCYNRNRKKKFITWYPDLNKSESQNAEELQRFYTKWKADNSR